jgi:hypothetical protein
LWAVPPWQHDAKLAEWEISLISQERLGGVPHETIVRIGYPADEVFLDNSVGLVSNRHSKHLLSRSGTVGLDSPCHNLS